MNMNQFKQSHIAWKQFLKEAQCPECHECASNVIAEVYYICKNGHKWAIPQPSKLKLEVINSNSSNSSISTSSSHHCESSSDDENND